MIHSVNNCENITETSVLDRQRSRLKRQQEPLTFFNENAQLDGVFSGFNGDQSLSELLMGGAMKPDPGLDSGLVDGFRDVLNYGNGSDFVMASYPIPRTASCPPNMAAAAADIAQETSPSSAAVGESSKKRKADKPRNLEVIGTGKTEDKKMKGCKEEESKITEQNSSSKSTTTTVTNNKSTKGPSANTKDNMKNSEYPKPDYIHVRARRGQATDSHSLAERVRREKISERMKFLQDLVPGCNRIIGKAGMLDEIINYVQSLQRQVEFLSMKLATINPTLDFDIDNYLVKEMYPDLVNHGSVQFNTFGQGVLNSSVEMVVNPLDVTLRRTISAPVSIPQAFLDSSGLNQIHHLTWEDELQNIYRMEYQQGQ